MYKVLLVDDERTILEGISSIVDWEGVGTALIGTASNGIEAMKVISDYQPDIVISDIMMPGLDGIELLEKSMQYYPSLKWIFLSGFNEFDYAQSAMYFGVKHYLLKPCNEVTISDALRDLVRELDSQKEKNLYVETMENKLEGMEYEEKNYQKELGSSKKGNDDRFSLIVSKMMDTIEANLENPNLSLHWIANEHIFMNVDYLGKLFKKEVGHKFSSYVTNKRIERAVKIIELQGDIKVFELADKLGFGNNPQYFSQIFKRITGVTPTDIIKSN